MDRTSELFGFLESSGVSKPAADYRKIQAPSSAQFTELAQTVQENTQKCRRDLANLKALARQANMMDDKSGPIQGLTTTIKSDLSALSQTLNKMEILVKESQGNWNSKNLAKHRQTVFNTLRSQWIAITQDFTRALQERSKNLREVEKRRIQYDEEGEKPIYSRAGGAFGDSADPRRPGAGDAARGNRGTDAPQRAWRPDMDDDNKSADVVVDLESGYVPGTRQHQLVQVRGETRYHESRVEAVEQVQRVIGELSTMLRRVATMVGQQEEMVARIDADMDDSLGRLHAGHLQLIKYFNAVANQRRLILKLLGLVLAFSCFFIIFLA